MTDYGASRLTRKCSLTLFFVVELVAFTLCLLALLSPTWQYVYLDNGRSEHHHGLWLDCVRILSFVYGDTEKNVETNWKREMEVSPFALFLLPDLNCVYKFDYYIDQEDLYDHNHDENRIQNDAWQHLFLGHKIATLCAVGVGFLFSFAALLVGICSYCHRTFICASTVLITMAGFFSSVGVGVFYMWANYQDNKVIKEEDMEVYEQQFGWAFHFEAIGAILHLVASVLGCFSTSMAFKKGRAKLVKIEVVEGDEGSPLASSSHLTSTTQPFKRSFSAIYRVDSEALRNWEKEYMKNMKQEQTGFKRTASVPNFTKKQRKAMIKAQREAARSEELFTSTSNIMSERTMTTGASNTLESHKRNSRNSPPLPIPMTPKSIMKKSSQSLAQISQRTQPDPSTTYEYLPGPAPSTIALSTFRPNRDSPSIQSSTKYDSVYETLPVDNYEEPNSIKNRFSNSTLGEDHLKKALLPTMPLVSGSAQSIPTQKTTLIDDIIPRPSTSQELLSIRERITREEKTIEELRRREMMRRLHENRENQEKTSGHKITFDIPVSHNFTNPSQSFPQETSESRPSLSIRDIGISLRSPQKGYATVQHSTVGISRDPREELLPKTRPPPTPPKPLITQGLTALSEESSSPSTIQINTFGEGPLRRSLTNLAMRTDERPAEVRELFSRPESTTSSIPSKTSKVSTTPAHRRLLSVIPDEVDRSVGSSTLLDNECLPNSANRLNYARDAEVRLNLFLNDSNNKESETTV